MSEALAVKMSGINQEVIPEIRPKQLKEAILDMLQRQVPEAYRRMKENGELEKYLEQRTEALQDKMRKRAAVILQAQGQGTEDWVATVQAMEQAWMEALDSLISER